MSLAHLYAFGREPKPHQPSLGEGGLVGAVTPDNERDLVEWAKRDREGFAALYEQHHRILFDHVYRRTGDTHATEDLVADVFLIAMRSLPRYRYRGIPVRFWLLRIATNTVNRWAQRRRRQSRIENAKEATRESTVSGESSVDTERVQRALLSLSPKFQAVLSLYHLEGLAVKEVAAVIGCREGTVRSRLSRARDALREVLGNRR